MSKERRWSEGREDEKASNSWRQCFSKGLNCFDKSQRREDETEQQSQGCHDRPRGWPPSGYEKMQLATFSEWGGLKAMDTTAA